MQNVTLHNGNSRAIAHITLKNNLAQPQAFKLSVIDFGSLNESGGVAFLGSSANSYASKYGLAKWMQLDRDTITLAAGGSQDISAAINNSPSLSPGGHYGAVLATALTAPTSHGAQPNIGVNAVLSSLILLIKDGAPPPQLKLVSQTVVGSPWSMPSDIQARFENAGDVHVTPRGVSTVYDPSGKAVLRGALNEDSGIVLPQTFRRYTTPLVELASARVLGRYKLATVYRYDGTNATETDVTYFWYLGPIWLWLSAIMAALLIVGGGFWLWRVRSRRSRRPEKR